MHFSKQAPSSTSDALSAERPRSGAPGPIPNSYSGWSWKEIEDHRREQREVRNPRVNPTRVFIAGKYYGTAYTTGLTPGRYPTLAAAQEATAERLRGKHKAAIARCKVRKTATKEGFVYVWTNPAWADWCKVGSAIDPVDRTQQLNTSYPFRDGTLVGYVYAKDRVALERRVHEALGKVYPKINEWFQAPPTAVLSFVQTLAGV